MASKEYSKLYTEDAESFGAHSDTTIQDHLCPKCSADIDDVTGISKTRRGAFGGASWFQICITVLLLTANLGTLGLWWTSSPRETTSSGDGDCIRPLLSYCEIIITLLAGNGF
jgi:hypothetical protein